MTRDGGARRGRALERLALWAAPLLLAGCAAGGPAPGVAVAQADAPLMEAVWAAEGAPVATILAVHGYGDHAASTFGEVAPVWAAAGLEVVAYDQRGFGANAGRGAWPGVDRLIEDFTAQAAAAKARRPDLPLIAVGHSMGAGVALAAVGEGRAPAVDALVLAAPAIAGGEAVSAAARAALWTLAAAAPDTRWTGRGVVEIQASDDIDMLRRLAADPLRINAPSGRELLGLVRVMDRARAAAPQAGRPALVLIGARDEVIDPAAMEAAATVLAPAADIRRYPEGWHMLFRDLQKETVWQDVQDWALAAAGRS
jgi:alpha-beta hydrolase superfamily lysophospholipase